MAKKDLSLKAITEVLIGEVEALQKSTEQIKASGSNADYTLKQIQELHTETGRRIEVLKNLEVQVDPDSINKALKGKTVTPEWVKFSFASIVLIALMGIVGTFYFRSEAKDWMKSNNHWYNVAVEHGYQPEPEQKKGE